MHQGFLLFSAEPVGDAFRLTLVSDLASAAPEWRASTRVSPVWLPRVTGQRHSRKQRLSDAAERLRSRACHVVVLGPIPPREIVTRLASLGDCWLTLGALNVVLVARDRRAAIAASDWALAQHGIAFERWEGARGVFLLGQRHAPGDHPADIIQALESLARRNPGPLLADVHSEFIALALSAATRAASCWPMLLPDLRSWINLVARRASKLRDTTNRLPDTRATNVAERGPVATHIPGVLGNPACHQHRNALVGPLAFRYGGRECGPMEPHAPNRKRSACPPAPRESSRTKRGAMGRTATRGHQGGRSVFPTASCHPSRRLAGTTRKRRSCWGRSPGPLL
jgi:hypothetical protein